MPRKLNVTPVGQTASGVPVYLVKQQSGRNGYGVALYRMGSTRRTTDLPFGVGIVDYRKHEIREAGRYTQRYAPISGGADAVATTVRWMGRQAACAQFRRVAREIGPKKYC